MFAEHLLFFNQSHQSSIPKLTSSIAIFMALSTVFSIITFSKCLPQLAVRLIMITQTMIVFFSQGSRKKLLHQVLQPVLHFVVFKSTSPSWSCPHVNLMNWIWLLTMFLLVFDGGSSIAKFGVADVDKNLVHFPKYLKLQLQWQKRSATNFLKGVLRHK